MSLAVRVSVRVPMEAYRGGSGLNGSGKKAKTCPRVTCGRVTRAPLTVISYQSMGKPGVEKTTEDDSIARNTERDDGHEPTVVVMLTERKKFLLHIIISILN